MSRFLIIGGSGFLGSYLTERLVNGNHEVGVADVVPPDNATRITPFLDKINYIWKSIHDLQPADIDSMDSVVYVAAQADVPLAISSPRYTFQQNVMGIVHTLELLRSSKSKIRTIFLSSENVYGIVPDDRVPILEDEILKPVNPYGASKAAADLVCQTYARAYDMPITVLRSGTMFGPRSRLKQAIPIFIRQALANQPITVEGDGSQSRDFNHVGNVVDAILLANQRSIAGVYNIASGEEVSILQVAKLIIDITKSSSQIIFKPWRPGEKGLRLALSIEKAKKELGYHPNVPFKEGLKRTVEWLEMMK